MPLLLRLVAHAIAYWSGEVTVWSSREIQKHTHRKSALFAQAAIC